MLRKKIFLIGFNIIPHGLGGLIYFSQTVTSTLIDSLLFYPLGYMYHIRYISQKLGIYGQGFCNIPRKLLIFYRMSYSKASNRPIFSSLQFLYLYCLIFSQQNSKRRSYSPCILPIDNLVTNTVYKK